MTINPKLLSILVCPETKLPVELAPPEMVSSLNQKILSGTLKNHAGNAVVTPFDAALIRNDHKRLYPIRNDIPIMLIEEGIDLV